MHYSLFVLLLFFKLIAFSLPSEFSAIYFFGDGFTDQGNYHPKKRVPCFKEAAPQVNMNQGELAGKMWSEIFANQFNLQADPSSQSGTNWAVATAQTTQVYQQAKDYLTQVNQQADPNALYVIWAGAEDLFQKVIEGKRHPAQVLIDGVEQTLEIVALLSKHGAKHILVIGLPDLSLTPFVSMLPSDKRLGVSAFCQKWNKLLFSAMHYLKQYEPLLNLYQWDPMPFMQAVHFKPSQFAFPDQVQDALRGPIPNDNTWWCGINMASDVDQYLFFSPLHFSSAMHALLAKTVLAKAEAL